MRRMLMQCCLLLLMLLAGLASLWLRSPQLARAGDSSQPARSAAADLLEQESPADNSASEEPLAPQTLTPQMATRRDQVRKALAAFAQRPVNARDHTPWEVFHWVIAYNVEAELYTRGPGGEQANAVGWLCFNRPCRGQQLLALENNRVAAQRGVGLEGHTGQFLAILGQSRVMADYPLQVGGKQFTVADLVETQKLKCQAGTELTFQLIGLAHYLDLDDTWKNSSGEEWSIPRLIREEISKPIHGSACGGTHRLMGLSYAVKKRGQRGQPIDGQYLRAQVYVNDYIQYTLKMQNPDGSFSTEWFSGRGARNDLDRRVQTTGHILEWMVFASSDEQLRDSRVVQAVDYLSKVLLADVGRDWKIGPLGHALRSLSLYDRRVFQPLDTHPVGVLASRAVTPLRSAATNPQMHSILRKPAEPIDDLLESADSSGGLFTFPGSVEE